MRELVVISGKGGTGKTSLLASFAALAEGAVLADADVDAADLHLLLQPEIRERHTFRSGREATIRTADCAGCGACAEHCRFAAIQALPQENRYRIDPFACEGCGVCVRLCPAKAIDFPEQVCGEWYVSDTRCGPMVHAALGIGAENSGKLVTRVREEARRRAAAAEAAWLLVDGPPGIGCPVIAAVTGADEVLVVTEPTLSGLHDLERVLELAAHFGIPSRVCVNKWDLNPALTERIERQAHRAAATVLGRISYDPAVTEAQRAGQSLAEHGAGSAAADVRHLWQQLVATPAPASSGA